MIDDEKINKFVNDLSIPAHSKYKEPEIINAIKMLIDHDSKISWVNKFEQTFAKRIGVSHAIACNSGTSGLHAALYAVGVQEGDEVLLPAMTVIMDAYTIMHLGAITVFVDVDERSHLMDISDLKNKLSPKTKAILTVSWEGVSCEMSEIMSIAKSRGLYVIDDSARNVMGSYKGQNTGSIADMTVFSMESKKHLTAGSEGGVIVSNNETLAIKARKYAGIGYKHLTADAGRTHLAIDTVQDPLYKRFDTVGLNYRMNEISAAVALGQLERLVEIVGKRKLIGKKFLEETQGYEWFIPQECPQHIEHSYYTFSVDYHSNKSKVSWKKFYKEYVRRGGDGFYGVVSIPYLEPSLIGKKLGSQICQSGLCPVAERLQERVMCFKTNYRDINEANKKIKILKDLLWDIESGVFVD